MHLDSFYVATTRVPGFVVLQQTAFRRYHELVSSRGYLPVSIRHNAITLIFALARHVPKDIRGHLSVTVESKYELNNQVGTC